MNENYVDDLMKCKKFIEEGDYLSALKLIKPYAHNAQRGFVPYQLMLKCIINNSESEPFIRKGEGAIRPVPKTVVQFWDSPHPPADVVQLMSAWRKKNEDFNFVLFDDEKSKSFIFHYYGCDVLASYEACFHPAMKSDLFRLAYIYKMGGIYVDADEKCLVPLRNWAGLDRRCIFVYSIDRSNPYIHNWFFSTPARNPIILDALTMAVERIQSWMAGASMRPYLWDVTGPGNMTRAVVMALSQTHIEPPTSTPTIMLLSESNYRALASSKHCDYKNTTSNWRMS